MKKNYISYTLLILCVAALAAYGQQQERVAIIQTLDNNDSVGISDLVYLTDRLRETAVKVLPKQSYGVMTTESIVAFLGSQEQAAKVCNESSCLADVGRKVSADYVAQARIGRFGNQLTINFQLYNTKSGNLIGSFTGNSYDVFGLLAIIDEESPALFNEMIYEKPYVPVPEVKESAKTSFWVAVGLDLLGAAFIGYAVYENSETAKYKDKYHETGRSQSYYDDVYKKAEDSRSSRNMFYVIGGVLLASGIGVHIWF